MQWLLCVLSCVFPSQATSQPQKGQAELARAMVLEQSEQDLKGASFDGFGEDWPLSYADLAPYYDLVEDYVGITGMAEGVDELPDSRFHPPMGLSCAEWQVRQSRSAWQAMQVSRLCRAACPWPELKDRCESW